MATELDTKALKSIQALQRPGKPDLLGKIVGLFDSESPKAITAIQDGVETADLEAIRAAAHGMKSSSAYVGATQLSTRCRELEEAARDGNFPACMVLSESLESDFEEAQVALRHFLDAA